MLKGTNSSLSVLGSLILSSEEILNAKSLPKLPNNHPIIHPTLSCSRCFLSFESATELRKHFRDSHGFGTPHLASKGEVDNERLDIEEDKDEEEEEEEEEDWDEDELLLDSSIDDSHNDRITFGTIFGISKPYIAFVLKETNYVCSCHSILVDSKLINEFGVDEPLKPLFLSIRSLIQPGELWLTILFRGGFFAGIVTEISPTETEIETSKVDSFPRIVLHKRFARYTTRRSQGGSQSAHDSSSGKAKSMGAQLRRHNERALVTDIHNLLQSSEWIYAVSKCRRVFISAAKTTIADLFDGKSLIKGDKRIQHVPFITSRPTIDEAFRVTKELASIKWIEEYIPLLTYPSSTCVATSTETMTGKIDKSFSSDNKSSSSKLSLNTPFEKTVCTSNLSLDSDSLITEKEPLEPTIIVQDSLGGIESTLSSHNTSTRKKPKKNKKKKTQSRATVKIATTDDTDNDDDDDEFLNAAMAAAKLEVEDKKANEEMNAIQHIIQESIDIEVRKCSSLCKIPQLVLFVVLGMKKSSIGESYTSSFLLEVKEKIDVLSSLLSSGMSPSEAFEVMGWSSLSAASVAQNAGFPVDWSVIDETNKKIVQLQTLAEENTIVVKSKKNSINTPREVVAPTLNRVSPADELVVSAVSEREQKRLAMLRAAERRAALSTAGSSTN